MLEGRSGFETREANETTEITVPEIKPEGKWSKDGVKDVWDETIGKSIIGEAYVGEDCDSGESGDGDNEHLGEDEPQKKSGTNKIESLWNDIISEAIGTNEKVESQETDTEDKVDDSCEDKNFSADEEHLKENSKEADEDENVEKNRMHPPVKVEFTCKEKYDKEEYERQVKNQEKGMNNISLYDYIKNRERYKENGRNQDVGGPAQEKARQEARADRIAENRRNGMSREEAEKEADQWLETQAALHDPDQVAGGDAANVTGMGDKEINSSIGSQWQYRIDAVDEAVQKYIEENNLSEEDLKDVYLNVDLEVVAE